MKLDPRCSEDDFINSIKPLSTLLDPYDFCTREINPKMQYDYIISCFEPVINVHGGIGSYTKLFLELHQNLEILLITATCEPGLEEWALDFPNISVAVLARHVHCYGENVNNIGDDYNQFSFNIFRYLSCIQSQGVEFAVIEFPDYGAEGFFAIRGVKAGLISQVKTLIRLHSPNFMLFCDNRMSAAEADINRVKMHSKELASMADCDQVLFGNDAMLHHVISVARDVFGHNFSNKKCIKVPHPWPSFKIPPLLASSRLGSCSQGTHSVNIGIIGRVEPRKGACLFAKQLRLIHSRLDINLENYCFHFFGADTILPFGDSAVDIVESILSGTSIKCVFHGKVKQHDLQSYILGMDALVYPSLFENYPNALLEVLRLPLPKHVSLNGGMAEICKEFSNVSAYDPCDYVSLSRFLEHARSVRADSACKTPREKQYLLNKSSIAYARIARKFNNLLISNTLSLAASGSCTEGQINVADMSIKEAISVIVPHYNAPSDLLVCIKSALRNLVVGDEIVIIDDFSSPSILDYLLEVVSQLRALARDIGVEIKLVSSSRNYGPGYSRNLGVQMAKGDFVYFLDADDVIIPGSLLPQRNYLRLHNDVSAVSSIMKAYGKENHFWVPNDSDAELVLFQNITHCGVLMRKDAYVGIGGYSAKKFIRYEDWEFFMRFTLCGLKMHVLPLVSYGYYRNQSVLTRNEANEDYHAFAYCQIVNNAISLANLKLSHMPQRLGLGRAIERAMVKYQEVDDCIKHPDVYPSMPSDAVDL